MLHLETPILELMGRATFLFLLFMAENLRSARSEMKSAESHEPVEKKELLKNIGKFLLAAAAMRADSGAATTVGHDQPTSHPDCS